MAKALALCMTPFEKYMQQSASGSLPQGLFLYQHSKEPDRNQRSRHLAVLPIKLIHLVPLLSEAREDVHVRLTGLYLSGMMRHPLSGTRQRSCPLRFQGLKEYFDETSFSGTHFRPHHDVGCPLHQACYPSAIQTVSPNIPLLLYLYENSLVEKSLSEVEILTDFGSDKSATERFGLLVDLHREW